MNSWSVKQEIILHSLSTLVLALVLTVPRYVGYPTLFIPLVVGSIIGMILPDIDHLIYALYLHPQDLSSQRVKQKLTEKKFKEVLTLLYQSREERRDLIFHSVFFVIIFEIFAFLIVTSSASLLGRGIVLSFLLHLLVDEYRDYKYLNSLNNWFTKLQLSLNRNQTMLVLGAQAILLLLFSFIF